MSVALVDGVIRIVGPGQIEDAEPLVAFLRSGEVREVDLSAAGPLHTAVVQALMAFRPAVLGRAGDPFVNTWLLPLLRDTGMAIAAGPPPVAKESPP